MTILSLIIFQYGITLKFTKAEKNHNPKSKEYNSDGSVKKFKLYKSFYQYSHYYLGIRIFYNYTITLFIHRNCY